MLSDNEIVSIAKEVMGKDMVDSHHSVRGALMIESSIKAPVVGRVLTFGDQRVKVLFALTMGYTGDKYMVITDRFMEALVAKSKSKFSTK